MVTTQSFRLLGKPDIKDIICDQVEGENVIVWEDIEQVFPGVKYITNGNTVISMMRDMNRNRVVPQCIKHYPGAVLDVVLSATSGDSPLTSSTEISSASHTEERLSAPIMTLDLEAEIVQRLDSVLRPKIQARLRTTSDGYNFIAQAAKDGRIDPSDVVRKCLQELKAEMTKNMELSTRVAELAEKKETKTGFPDQMAQIRRRVQSLLTRDYDPHEDPIPRLFVVLPLMHSSLGDSQGTFSNTFRLYFLCDCGEHTMSSSTRTSHHIHLAKHEGYEITHPKEFFQEFGIYVLTVLQMLKFGISLAGITVSSLLHVVKPVASCQTSADLQFLVDTIESGMDLVMGHIEKVHEVKEAPAGLGTQMSDSEIPKCANLRELKTFLKGKEGGLISGNLYRTVTPEGHTRWICADHYRETYQEKAVKALCDTAKSLKGSYNENLGCVNVPLRSRDDADQFNLALEKMKGVYEISIGFSWEATQRDFKRLRDTLARCNVGTLRLNLNCKDGPTNGNEDLSQKYDPILDLMRHPSIRSVKIAITDFFFKQSSLQTCDRDFSNLRHLEIYWGSNDLDIPSFKGLITKASNLASLVLGGIPRGLFLQLYGAIAEHQTYSIDFVSQSLRILPPTNKSDLSRTTFQDKADLLRSHGGRIERVYFTENELNESIAAAFAKGTESGSCLKEITLGKAGRDLGNQGVKDLASLVARSELRKLNIHLENKEERVQVLESIQWEKIRDLAISMNEESHGMSPLKALVDGIKMLSGKAELEYLYLDYVAPRRPLPVAQEQLLQSFVALTSLKRLQLWVLTTPDQMLSLLKSANLSRLEYLTLLCEKFKSNDIDSMLDTLQLATKLRTIFLVNCEATKEQKERAKAKGVTLSTY